MSHMCTGLQRPEEGPGSLERESQAVLSCLTWVLETNSCPLKKLHSQLSHLSSHQQEGSSVRCHMLLITKSNDLIMLNKCVLKNEIIASE